jgi:hypothetical protein
MTYESIGTHPATVRKTSTTAHLDVMVLPDDTGTPEVVLAIFSYPTDDTGVTLYLTLDQLEAFMLGCDLESASDRARDAAPDGSWNTD